MVSTKKSSKRPRIAEDNDGMSKKGRPFESPLVLNSALRSQRAFQWLISPHTIQTFYADYFEKQPLHLQHDRSMFSSLFSVDEFSDLVHSGALKYCTDLDVTSYTADVGRETLNEPTGTVVGADAWKRFSESGCSLRLLRPQAHSASLWSLCALLEGFFECAVGANVYLTPATTQGFAPHFDDIDAFVCQVSGRKHWKVYSPAASGHDVLPRASSIDFTPDDMAGRELVFHGVLEPGALLYLPRGAIHEARAAGDGPSLHVTLSAGQKWTWADFLVETIGTAIRSAAASDVALRRSLPLRFAQYMGQGRVESDDERREKFEGAVKGALRRVAKHYPIDAAADAMAERFLGERLPPPTSVTGEKSKESGPVKLKSRVRAAGVALARVSVADDGMPKLSHCFMNERKADGDRSAATLPCLPEEAAAVDFILSEYPKAVMVKDVPLVSEEDRLELVEGLVEMGIVCLV